MRTCPKCKGEVEYIDDMEAFSSAYYCETCKEVWDWSELPEAA